MQNWKLITAAAALALVGSSVVASAQDATVYRPAKKHTRGLASRESAPLTVRPVAAPAPTNPLVTPITAVGTLATAPLGGLSQAFGLGPVGGPARPLPIVARYAGAGPVTDSVNQGWAHPVPLSAKDGAEVAGYVERIGRQAGLDTAFGWDGDEVVLTDVGV